MYCNLFSSSFQAAAAALQKPLPYRLYPGSLGPMAVPGPSAPFPHLTASNSLSSLSSYYHHHHQQQQQLAARIPPPLDSPPLDPGSPPAPRSDSRSPPLPRPDSRDADEDEEVKV